MLAWLKKNRGLLLVIFLAVVLRFYHLSSNPPALSWDEAAIGWNAKTIFHTRRDEYGTLLPLSFKSFGDFKSPAYIYLTAPLVGFFGMNEITVRLVSVLAGLASVVVIYYLTKELLPQSKSVALLSALLLTITPWHVLVSRPAFEPNLALLFVLFDLLFFLKGLKNGKYLYLSAFFFILSLYTYHSPKIFSLLLFIPLTWIYRKKLFSPRKRKHSFLAALLALLLLLPLAKDTLAGGSSRFQGTSIFYTQAGEPKPLNLSLAKEIAGNYLIHYSPQFLFFGGNTIPRIQMRQNGLFLFVQAPFLIWGLIYLFKHRRQPWAEFLFAWLLIGPVPAMIGFEVPHPIRSLNLLPALTIVSALGLTQIKQLKQPLVKKLIILGFIINTTFFIYRYFTAYPIYSAPDWQYGYKQAVQLAQEYEDQIDKILFTSHYGQPHIFAYFYQQREPLAVFWGAMIKYTFRDLNWDEDQHFPNVLVIGSPEEIPQEANNLVEQIDFPDGSPAFRLVKNPVKINL